MPADWRIRCEARTNPNHKLRCITDFIAGMTDRHALAFFQRLKAGDPGTIFKEPNRPQSIPSLGPFSSPRLMSLGEVASVRCHSVARQAHRGYLLRWIELLKRGLELLGAYR
ncbi:hypothetical protein I6F35_38395 [Bradyrhizobium sp. BRP22]|nr:hypothetical protein [Bradyrhizobium sp. BRP22]